MPGVVSADLFERAVPMLPLLSTFGSQKHFKCNSYLESLAQNLLIITMMFVLVLFATDVFDVGYYVVCYENSTVVKKKDINICVESMKESIETQPPEYLTLLIGIFLGVMFLINGFWEFCFQTLIRKHVEEVIYELNDSVYRAMMVDISENTERSARRISIYKKPLTLYIDDISPMNCCRCICIHLSFFIKNLAYCLVAGLLSRILYSLTDSYNEEFKVCKIENRNLLCNIPEYNTLKWIKNTA
ncbi:uncharacterized protein LOC119951059 [Scyliorhinus canicula]|uniref:uncharacterized protein LOC119951059 n=1 Tax=Scyliorhinus canicula TaxID=7830 RepID=UPI0018F27C53|nr:uncharacterized protein LOC119951059 [Scyliorhinus canicula]